MIEIYLIIFKVNTVMSEVLIAMAPDSGSPRFHV